MKLWLDDVRNPENFDHTGWHWVRTADEAIAWLAAREPEIEEASLDHDLGWIEKILGNETKEKTGYDVILFLEEYPRFWPKNGVKVHSQNPVGKRRMEIVINRHYGRTT